ncbi:hypothetical protein PENTCL1PPCAC_11864, partial [Pristionchus entomophagus]
QTYYGRVDAASRRTESARENQMQPGEASQKAQQMLQDKAGEITQEASAVNPSDTDADDDAAEDELHGRNPNKMSVVREQSPTNHSAGIKVMMKKRKSVAQRSVVCSSLPRSATVSALSIFAPRILFDSTSRGLEIMDIVSKGVDVMQTNETKLRETIVEAIMIKLDEIRECRHICFAIPEKNGEPIVKGASSIVGMMRQTLVLTIGFEMPAMRVYCYELDVGESVISILAPGKSGSGSGNRSNTAVDRVTRKETVRSGGVLQGTTAAAAGGGAAAAAGNAAVTAAAAAAKSPAPKAQHGPANQSGSSGKEMKERKGSSGKMTVALTQMTVTAPARSPIMPSSTCLSTCPTKKSRRSAATPTPQKRSVVSKRKTGKRNSNYSRLRTARTPRAKTPQRTMVTAIEESLYSVQTANTKKSRTKS